MVRPLMQPLLLASKAVFVSTRALSGATWAWTRHPIVQTWTHYYLCYKSGCAMTIELDRINSRDTFKLLPDHPFA
ncbi:hypothetical protein BKA56DRAFT_575265 [Ilyonectria sp. MPI-CAGE-AT-0026]|nr:hypothetical protein BKA56DRAFT_575265 [Ilyonectria sp. MPI-CAGE-AT-0026]